jgi:hypothetical protein
VVDRTGGEPGENEAFASWLSALEQRHLSDLRFPEVTRALRALSTDYVARRDRVRHAALDGRGKRAAFALFYGPLHFLIADRVARALGLGSSPTDAVIDLGCGTGAAGAAAALVSGARTVTGIDRHAWAVEEARWTYRSFGLRARTVRADLCRALGRSGRGGRAASNRTLLLAAYTVNELTSDERGALLPMLMASATHGSSILVIEPISRSVTPWWPSWSAAFGERGGRAGEWRFTAPLPAQVRTLDRAAGLDHREQTARTLWLPPTNT